MTQVCFPFELSPAAQGHAVWVEPLLSAIEGAKRMVRRAAGSVSQLIYTVIREVVAATCPRQKEFDLDRAGILPPAPTPKPEPKPVPAPKRKPARKSKPTSHRKKTGVKSASELGLPKNYAAMLKEWGLTEAEIGSRLKGDARVRLWFARKANTVYVPDELRTIALRMGVLKSREWDEE